MSLCIAVLGATGVYGRHLVPRLIAACYRVRALVRKPETAASDYAKNDRLRREGTPIWVRACRDAGVPRIVQQSIALIHAGGGDAWADETTFHPVGAEGIAAAAISAALAMEAAIEQSGLDWIILRGGLFYGPGTGFDDDWFARARAGRLRLPGEGDDYVSLVHIADMACATMAALSRWPSRQALIVADDHPACWRDVLTYVCAAAGGIPPQPGGRALMPSFRVANRRARDVLSWAPVYVDYRAGLAR